MQDSTIAQKFWEKVFELMDKQGKKQAQLGRESGMLPSSLSTARTSPSIPLADNAVSIAKALNTTVEFLVTGTDDYSEGTDPELDDALRYIRTSRPASRLAKVMPLLTLAQYEALESVLKSWGLEEKE